MMRGGLLEALVAAARHAAEAREAAGALSGGIRGEDHRPRGDAFVAALRSATAPRIVAECKRRSPSRGILRQEYDPAELAGTYQRAGAAAISVLTEPTFFDGALEHLAAVRMAVDLPILRKDFVVTQYQLREAATHGADAVLLIAGALDDRELARMLDHAASLGLAALVEVHTEAELERALDAGANVIGVNSRDLRTLHVDAHVHDRLISRLPSAVTAVAESGIAGADDIHRLSSLGYHAFLVGERLVTAPDTGQALQELRSA